ncbi:hypothetical protein L3X38_043316 [Prunus dulcis]|uniref:Uncharacterized protein n=1 Tax=Prunus dulcis TaxID=3755 RepID=A0AAD4YM52_PRUDU|nr:hypothetical protein L3X38_043316 [Prunus dulcis]
MSLFSRTPWLLLLLLCFLGLVLGFGDAFKVTLRIKDVLPVLPRQISWPVLNNFHSAVDLLPSFIGSVTPDNTSIEWEGACFSGNQARLEFTEGDRDKPNLGGGVLYLKLLGTGMVTQDTSSSVLLFFDKQKFIFNVVERWPFVVLDRAVWLVLSVLLSKGVKTSIKQKKNHEESAKQSSIN